MKATAAIVVIAAFFAMAVAGSAEPACTMIDDSTWDFGDSYAYSSTGDGRYYAYTTWSEIWGYEIYLGDAATGGWLSLTDQPELSANPDLSLEGDWITFISEADFVGSNPDSNQEVFLLERATGEIRQVSDSVVHNNFTPRTSADGRLTLFTSWNDLTGQNPDGSMECFLFDRISGELTQLIEGSEDRHCVMNAQGTSILVNTSEDLLGHNEDGNVEIYRIDLESGWLTQLTDTTTGENRAAWASDDGSRFAFYSSSERYFPHQPIQRAVMIYDLEGPEVWYLDHADYSSSTSLELSGAGNRLVTKFGCFIFLWDLETRGRRTLYTNTWSCIGSVRGINRYGTRFYASLRDDPTGSNPDHSSEIFRLDCPIELFLDGFESGSTSAWTLTTP